MSVERRFPSDGERVVEVLSEGACVQAFIVRATQPTVGCVRALGEAKVAQGKEPCGRPRWPVWGASEIREHAHACIGSLWERERMTWCTHTRAACGVPVDPGLLIVIR